MKMKISDLKRYISDIFLPNRCPSCSKLIVWNKLMCDKCREKLRVISAELCPVCGKRNCKPHNELEFDNSISLFYFDDCKDAIYSLKYHKGINFARYCAPLFEQELKKRGLDSKADLVTCVPMSRKKRRRRGYNQAQIIAQCVAEQIGKPFDNSLLLHSDDLTEHHYLKGSQRKENAEKSFFAKQGHSDIKGKNVLLCDDVYTYGATMNICAKCLKQLGANSVTAVSIANSEKNTDKTSSAAP